MAIRINSLRLYPERVVPLLEQIEPIGFYGRVCDEFVSAGLLDVGSEPFHVKVCLDDVHQFRHREQLELNTIVAASRAPISWNLSYVSGCYEPVVTANSQAPLTSHDVEVLDLNYQNDQEGFRKICRQMYFVRVGGETRPDTDDERIAAYEVVLGRPNPNKLFFELYNKSQSVKFKNEVAKNLQFVMDELYSVLGPHFGARSAKKYEKNERHYLYQTYIFSKLFRGDVSDFHKFISNRSPAQVDNYFRQKSWAALICAANELGARAPYAGVNTVHSLADGCLRDFLRLLAVIYDELAMKKRLGQHFDISGAGFIGIAEQSDAMRAASRTYLEQLDNSKERHGYILSKLVGCVGVLTRKIQSQDRTKALSRPERGIFKVGFGEKTLFSDRPELKHRFGEVLRQGQYRGVIRILDGMPENGREFDERECITFRLHRIVSPAFNYSPRGPFRPVKLPLQYFLEVVESPELSRENWADRAMAAVEDIGGSTDDETTDQGGLF